MAAAKQDVDQLLNQLRVRLIGASDAELKAEVFDTLREFYNESNSWTEEINFNIVADVVEYDITPTNGQIVRLAGVVDDNGVPQPAVMPSIGHLVFRNPYDSTAVFTAVVVLTVSLPTDKNSFPIISDKTLPLYSVGIADGVCGKLAARPKRSYTDQKLAMYYAKRFQRTIIDARNAVWRRNTIGTQAWSFPQGFGTRTQRGGVSIGSDTRFT